MEAVAELLKTDGWFAGLASDQQAMLTAALRERPFEKGEHVYRIGDAPDGLWVVLAGEVRLVSYSAAGEEAVGLILRPGRWFGELSVLDEGPRPHDAVTLRRSGLGFLPMATLADLALRNPQLWRSLAILTCRHHRRTLARLERTLFQSARTRLASLLGAALDTTNPSAPIHINQTELANTVGVSRQRLNRLLAELRAKGIVQTSYGAVIVLEPQRLAEL